MIENLIDGTPKDSITSSDMTKYYTKTTKYSVTVKNGDNLVTSGNVVFTIDNKQYTAKIGSNGVATVSLKTLKPGTHYITAEYAQVLVKNKITVKKVIITKNVSKKVKKSGKFTVKIQNSKGKVYEKQTVKVKFKGKTYKLKTNKKGIATLNLSKKLKVGKYTVKTTYQGLTVSNKITVKK
jgi:predicted secreted protein